ncbi:hypothetical protein BGZ83_011502 [Gryganskiella cystojenkinii]|nr:hypothetical protein BGZ83_011502 [Gryganskiella cystojenkinii]
MAQHHVSPYHDVKNVQMIASPLFKVPVHISPPYDMHALPSDILHRRYHEFTLEHRIVQEYQRIMTEEASVLEAKENAYKLYAEERQARLKQERLSRARKIAPGFLDNDDRRILTPTLVAATTISASSLPKDYGNEFPLDNKSNKRFDYSEFEGGDSPVVDNSAAQFPSSKDEKAALAEQDQHQYQQPRQQTSTSSSPNEDHARTTGGALSVDEPEEEVIVQAVPLSELTGMLRDSCLEEESSSNAAPRQWTERDAASEKSSQPSFSAARLDYREFEQGLGPPDPWDTPVDDLAALKDVIAQQMGHSNVSTGATSSQQLQQQQGYDSLPTNTHAQNRGSQVLPQQEQQQLQQPPQQQYSYQQQPQPQQQPYQPQSSSAEPVHSSYQYGAHGNNGGNNSSGTNPGARPTGQYNSSPIPVAAYTPTPKLTGLALQHQLLQQHQQHQLQQPQQQQQQQQQPHRHSTGGVGGMTPAQQQARFGGEARFGSASPSPPPLPPPPRGMNASPTAGATAATGGISRPPIPARPNRPTDGGDSPSNATASDQTSTVILDRSMTMTPPRPPLPPPPPTSSSVATLAADGSSSSAPRPALRPRPPKDHEMFVGLKNNTKGPALPGSFPDEVTLVDQQQQQQQQQLAPAAPPHAETLINQLVHMGFTREQSRGALEKYDYDLEKASNHLLDWDE